jgi:hypothetical protein
MSLLLAGCLNFVAHDLTPTKAYGEYWFKPGMTKESWQQVWVACGGRANGSYSSDAASGSSTSVLIAASEKKRNELTSCMKVKGYVYRDTSLP